MTRFSSALLAAIIAGCALLAEAADPVAIPFRLSHPAADRTQTTNRIIVKLKPGWTVADLPIPQSHVSALSVHAQTTLTSVKSIAPLTHVLQLPAEMSNAQAEATAAAVATHESVDYAVADYRRYPTAIAGPNDPYFQAGNQWNLFDPATQVAGINMLSAWAITQGSPTVTVAVLDSGITDHVDLPAGPWTSPNGYDFVGPDPWGTFLTANDGGGWDADPHDPGDWVSAGDAGTYQANNQTCTVQNSDWHGTSVTGVIGAIANNNIGITGIAPGTTLLPVRVLGKCGGYDSDIIAGLNWAAGAQIPAVAPNVAPPQRAHPADVINLSLGSSGTGCSSAYADAISQAYAKGVRAIVTAAGNHIGSQQNSANANTPGNCPGVIDVAAVNQQANLSNFSDSGSVVTLSAPGGELAAGNQIQCSISVFALFNSGTTGPANDAPAGFYGCTVGTSIAAPQVSAVAALMIAANPALTATQVTNILQATARAFPANSTCNQCSCGAGLLDAGSAVAAAVQNPGIVPTARSCPTTPSAAPATSSGSSGKGGCTAVSAAPFDPTLALLALGAGFALARTRRRSIRSMG